MKKTLLSLITICLTLFVLGQSKVQRQEVLLEIGTGTWCQFCPGAAMGAEDLIANGCDVAVIEYHRSDSYTNTASNTRASYYGGMGSIPTSYFDGVVNVSGGNATTSMYSTYLPKYEMRIAIGASVSIEWYGYHEGNTYTVTAIIQKHEAVSNDLTYHLCVTESGIQEAWQNQTELHYVERWMANEGDGVDISLSGPAPVTQTITFDIDASWNLEELELVAFVQDNVDKEVQQSIKVMLENLPPPPPVADFVADQTDFCDMGTVVFTDNSSFAEEWAWSFPGGNPATSTLQNPTVSYDAPGIYDVSLTVTNPNTTDTKLMNNYINVLTAPASPEQPSGATDVCTTNMMDSYSVTPVEFATSYQWILTPPEAGVVFGTGASANASWTGDYIGDVTLKVKAMNSCGESEFSPEITITINVGPDSFAVTGGGEICEGDDGVEIGLAGSTETVSYKLYKNGTATGIVVTGDGNAISFGEIAENGMFTVKASDPSGICTANMSGNAEVIVHALPLVFALDGEGAYCEGTNGATITLDGSEDGIKYELYKDGVASEVTEYGTGNEVSFVDIMEEGVYTVFADNEVCANEMNGSVEVSILPMPAVPATPEGDNDVCINYTPTTAYTTLGGNDAVTYDWSLEPAAAGTISGTGMDALVTWDNTFDGNANVAVRGENSCGQSTFSASYEVHARMCTGIDDNETAVSSIYPNPATATIHVDLFGNTPVSIKVADALGKVVFVKDNVAVNGAYTETISVEEFSKGVYFVFISSESNNSISKVVIK